MINLFTSTCNLFTSYINLHLIYSVKNYFTLNIYSITFFCLYVLSICVYISIYKMLYIYRKTEREREIHLSMPIEIYKLLYNRSHNLSCCCVFVCLFFAYLCSYIETVSCIYRLLEVLLRKALLKELSCTLHS